MRVVHLSTFDKGGAARSALRLHQGLLRTGIESDVIVREKGSQEERVHGLGELWAAAGRQEILFQEFQKWYFNHNRTELSNTHFSLGEPGLELAAHPLIAQADVIQLHWVAGMLSPAGIRSLAALGKPIVWTLHDQRPFTGGCHFSAGCQKYEENCSGCPQIAWDPFLMSAVQLLEQKEFLGDLRLEIVSPSRWLADAASKSALFRGQSVQVIPYSIDTQLFVPRERPSCRKELGIPEEGTYLLFAADNSGEKRKGFPHLLQAVRRLLADADGARLAREEHLALLCLGHSNAELQSLGIPVHALGYINDDRKTAAAYGASDLFVLPSLEDNLPNTVMEALSCGRPVVAFRAGGIPELVEDGENGFLAPLKDESALAQALSKLIASPGLRIRMGAAGRERILDQYPIETQAIEYQKLYHKLAKADSRSIVASVQSALGFTPATERLQDILYSSLPAPALEHLYAAELRYRSLTAERDAHVKTIFQQTDFIKRLQKLAELAKQRRRELNQLIRRRPVKWWRYAKFIQVKNPVSTRRR